MTTDVATRVALGAALLDERLPDWYTRVSAERLKLSDPQRCVLGQLFGNYFSDAALEVVQRSNAFSIAHGFDVNTLQYGSLTSVLTWQSIRSECEVLEAAWVVAIAERHQ